MAETTELAALDAQLAAALATTGSTLTFEPAAPVVPTASVVPPAILALDDEELPDVEATLAEEPAEPAPDTPVAATQPTAPAVAPAPTPATPPPPRFVTAEDLQALQAAQAQQTRELITAILQAQREPAPAPTATPPPVSLSDAVMQAMLTGDKASIDAYEAQRQAERAEAERQAQNQRDQQAMIQELATRYPFLRDEATWQRTLVDVQALQANPLVSRLLPNDPRHVVSNNGQPLDLRVLAMAAHAMQASQAATQQATTAAATVADDTVRQQRPGAQAATPPAARPKATPSLLVPASMLQGEDALLNDPRVQRALAAVPGWGKDPRTQAKHLAERLPARTRAELQRQYRDGNRVGVA